MLRPEIGGGTKEKILALGYFLAIIEALLRISFSSFLLFSFCSFDINNDLKNPGFSLVSQWSK